MRCTSSSRCPWTGCRRRRRHRYHRRGCRFADNACRSRVRREWTGKLSLLSYETGGYHYTLRCLCREAFGKMPAAAAGSR